MTEGPTLLLSPLKFKDVTSSERLKNKFESQDDCGIKVDNEDLQDIHLLWGTWNFPSLDNYSNYCIYKKRSQQVVSFQDSGRQDFWLDQSEITALSLVSDLAAKT